ncbi:MAG TPA: biotin/lipoyl-binding protein, partial [Spirochaetia bacterium]|nr:biotin/lipoyl-binding protein [Spirochaetia bacterium]
MSGNAARRRFPTPYVVLGVIVAAAAAAWFAVPRPQKEEAAPRVFPVETVTPQIGSLERSLTVDSYVQSDSVVTVLPKVAGTIVSFSADVGTHLEAGQVIATVDPEPYRLTVDQAQAAFGAAESVWERVRKLHDSGAASQQSFDQAQAQYDD